MPDAAPEIVYTGSAKPPGWKEWRAMRFVKEKIIAPHTPHAHEEKIRERFSRLSERLEGKPKKIALRIKPFIDIHAHKLGVAQTAAELTAVAAATVGTYLLAERVFPNARVKRERIGQKIRSVLRRPASKPQPHDTPALAEAHKLYEAACQISRGTRVEDILLVDPIQNAAKWKAQRKLREQMFDLVFIGKASGGLAYTEREKQEFFVVLDKIHAWVAIHSDMRRALSTINKNPNLTLRRQWWQDFVRVIHTQAITATDYSVGSISDPEFFPRFFYDLELYLGRFGPIPKGTM